MTHIRVLLVTLLTIALMIGTLSGSAIAISTEDKMLCTASIDDEFVDDRVLLVLTEIASRSTKTYTPEDFAGYGCTSVTELNEAMAGNGDHYKKVICLDLDTKSKENVLSVIDELILRDDVLYAGPDYITSVSATWENDTFADDQWAIDHINLPQAWDYTTGSSSILVGVMDSGIDGTHPELSGMLVRSLCRDFTSGSEVVVTNPTDPVGHGTHVAGIIGAAGNNNLGVTGVTWNIGLVSLRTFDQDGDGSITAFAMAVNYAEEQNIPILNYSGDLKTHTVSNVVINAIIEPYSGILVCSAGNNSANNDGANPNYPASCTASNIIAVGAIDDSNERCDFSNFGAISVDIYAPGEDILSTFPRHLCENDIQFNNGIRLCEISAEKRMEIENLITSGQYTWNDVINNFESLLKGPPAEFKVSTHRSDGYHYMNGTSMATPYVTGVAALLLCENPNLTTAQLKTAIISSGDNITITLPDNTTQTVKSLDAHRAILAVHVIHTYTQWKYHTNTTHIEKCLCGQTGVRTATHVVSAQDAGTGYKTCIDCKARLLISGGDSWVVQGLGSRKITDNGSFVLANGIVVLVEADLALYLSGQLTLDDISALTSA